MRQKVRICVDTVIVFSFETFGKAKAKGTLDFPNQVYLKKRNNKCVIHK